MVTEEGKSLVKFGNIVFSCKKNWINLGIQESLF